MLYRLEEPRVGTSEGLVVGLPICDWGLEGDLEVASVISNLDISVLLSAVDAGCGTPW